MMKKRIFRVLTAALLVCALVTSALAAGYTSSNWAKESMAQAESAGLIPATLRSADLTGPISREDFAAVCVNTYLKMGGSMVTEPDNPFTDTDDPYVLQAYALGFANGMGEGIYAPDDSLTREQGAAMLTRVYKAVKLSGWTLAEDAKFPLDTAGAPSFTDAGKIGGWAKESVDFMALNDILNGMSDGSFAPKNSLTAEQAVAIALRMVNNLNAPSGTATPPTGTPANRTHPRTEPEPYPQQSID